MLEIFSGTFNWIKEDWQSHRVRFCLEVVAWAISIGCAITMATTVPNPPLLVLYPIWITGCAIYAWCAFSRRSFGMLANYILLVSIDSVGLIRMIIGS
jgi:cellulose synthase/poly-beta-1,6-N-acetylglucosamine synthase-like glycosyltransferase